MLLYSQDVNVNFNIFIDKLHELYSECFPLKAKYISEKRLNNPWITANVIKSIKTKNNLYKDYKVGAVTENQYKLYRNMLNRIISNAKKSYYMNLFTNYKNDTKKVWNAINQLKNNHKKTYLSYIFINNKILRTPSEISNAFNEYYTNIAVNLDNNIPPATFDPTVFLRGDYPTSMSVHPVIHSDVTSVIKSLKNKKSNANEIPVSIIKDNCEHIAIPLSIIFNQSIGKGIFPQPLKHATVIPIYKNGPKNILGNYRPISLLSTFSKIFEKLMKKSLLNFLESRSIITPEQFGFRQSLSTFHPLKILSENIYSALDSQHSLLGIFIDFCKAFDTVRHDILLKKLKHYGIRGVIHDWFKDYLSNRTQSTKILNHISSPQDTKYGVLQGSVLGPILFLIYINDLPQIFPRLKSVLFADDSTLYITGDDPISMIETANSDLEILKNWCYSNRLTINSNKTFYMLFTKKSIDILPPLKYDNSIIAKTEQHKMLGITFDEDMTFKPHISHISHKISRIISLLYQVKNLMPSNVLQLMYNAHVLPHFQYCTPIWCNTYPTHLLPLFRLQKK